jgi:predicted PolB exonuclease-like 3'-5' exonuclease
LIGTLDDEVRAEMGDKFPKLIYHSIVCIGALVAQREDEYWAVSAIGAPNIGERSEKEIISAFVNRIADLTPQLVTFNGADLRLAGRALSRNGLRGWRAWAGGARLLQSIYRRRD